MRPAKPPRNQCPYDAERGECNLQCKYNHFEADELVIDSWELKCLDCGYRETIAYRTDEPESLEDVVDPRICPFCTLSDLSPGRNPCDKCSS